MSWESGLRQDPPLESVGSKIPKAVFSRSPNSRELAALAVLLALNVWIVWRLFFVDWLDQFQSIEGAFVGLCRFLSIHPSGAGWLPLWHGGMPFEIVYVPGLHFLTGWTAWLTKMSPAHAYHLVTAIFYVLGPLAVYLLLRRMGASVRESLLAATIYSIFSISTLLIRAVWWDMNGSLASRRLHVLVDYGEGPHVSALTFVPLVLLALQSRRMLWAALATAAVLVLNVPATMGLALLVFCWIAVQEDRLAALRLAAGTGVLAYLMAMGAVPPSKYLRVIDTVGQMHPGLSPSPIRFLLLAACLAVAFALAVWLKRWPLHVRFFTAVFCLLVLIVVSATPNHWELLPQAQRLHLEMDLAFSVLAAAAVFFAIQKTSPNTRRVIATLVILLVCRQAFKARQKARTEIRPANLAIQSEYQSAKWLAENFPNTRVFAPGSTGFWLNAFTGVPQIGGCCDESWGAAGEVLRPLIFRVDLAQNEKEARDAAAWLRIYGVGALIANGPNSTEYYGDFRHPERYSFLPVLHEGFGDVIYQVPDSGGMFYVVQRSDLVTSRVPSDLEITPDVRRYLDATTETRRARAQSDGPDRIRIDAPLQEGDVIATKMAYADGWSIGKGRIFMDKLGLMVLDPECRGQCTVTLEWVGLPMTHAARWISLATLAVVGILLFTKRTHFSP